MGKPRMHLSGPISHFVEKDEEKAGEKITGSNNAVFHQISLLEDLAISNDRLVAWGIRLPIQDNVCTTGKPNQWQRPIP